MSTKHAGLFLPWQTRMSQARLMQMIVPFMDGAEHYSPSGLTARLLVNHCLENNFPFSVEYVVHPAKCYIVRLMSPGDQIIRDKSNVAPWLPNGGKVRGS
jgi:hypothetical protein